MKSKAEKTNRVDMIKARREAIKARKEEISALRAELDIIVAPFEARPARDWSRNIDPFAPVVKAEFFVKEPAKPIILTTDVPGTLILPAKETIDLSSYDLEVDLGKSGIMFDHMVGKIRDKKTKVCKKKSDKKNCMYFTYSKKQRMNLQFFAKKNKVSKEEQNKAKEIAFAVKVQETALQAEKASTLLNLLEQVELHNCVIANFTGKKIKDPIAWRKKEEKESSVITLALNGNREEIIKHLIDAGFGEGEYAHRAIVVSKNRRFKKPAMAIDFETKNMPEADAFKAFRLELSSLLAKNGFENIYDRATFIAESLKIGTVEFAKQQVTNIIIEYFAEELAVKLEKEKARDDARIAMAQKLRALDAKRKSIYTEKTGTFDSYEMCRDIEDSSIWHFKKKEVKMALSELLRAIVTEYNLDYVALHDITKHYRFTSILQLNFETDFAHAEEFKRIFMTPENKLYVGLNCLSVEADEELGGESVTAKKGYRELTTKSTVSELPEGSVEFINVAHGASGVRKNASFYLLNDGKIESVLDRASRGIYSRFKGKMMNISNTVKANTRIMASAAPSRILHKIESFAIIVDKIGKGNKDNIHHSDFKHLNGTLDGIAYSIFYAMQARLGSSKIFASQITPRLMQMIIRFLDVNPITLEVGEKMTQEQRNIMAAVFAKPKTRVIDGKKVKGKFVEIDGKLTDIAGRVIICKKIGSEQNIPQYLTDLNGYKADFDIAKGFEIPVLDMPIKNNAHSSTQFLNKVIAAGGKKAIDLITKRMKKYLDELITNFTADSEVSIKDLKDPFVAGIVGKAVPEYMKADVAVRRSNVKLLLNSISKALNKMRFPITDSANGRAIPDIGALFGLTLIKDDEFFTVDVSAGEECIIIKYPTIGEKEFWKCIRVSYAELCKRIDALEVPEQLKGFGNDFKVELKNYYRNMAPGCAVMSASKVIMAGLAGMDFDYDMIIAIYDKEFVALFANVKPGVIHIMNPSDDFSAEQEFSFMTMSNPQLALIAKEAASVGGVTNNYSIPMQYDLFTRYHQEVTADVYANIAVAQINGWDTSKLRKELSKRKKQEKVLIERFAIMLDYAYLTARQVKDVMHGRKKFEMSRFHFNGKAPSLASQMQFGLTVDRSLGQKYVPIGEDYRDPSYIYMPVSKKQKEDAEKRMRVCKIDTFEDILMICTDINRIARSDQETTIDSAKTSIVAKVVLNFNKTTNVFSKVAYEYGVDRETNNIYRDVQRPYAQPGDLGKKCYVYDLFSMIRDNVEAYIIPKVQDIMTNFTLTKEEILSIAGTYEGAISGLSAAQQAAGIYGTIAYNNAMNPGVLEKDFSSKYYKAIHFMIKEAVKDNVNINASANAFGKFVYWLSTFIKGDGGSVDAREVKTSLNSTCFPIETLYFAYKLSKKLCRVCEPVTVIESEIVEDTMLEFINGDAVNEDGRVIAVAKQFLNGEFKMMKVNGKYFACDRASNYLKRDNYDKSYVAFAVKGGHVINANQSIAFDAWEQNAYSTYGSAKVTIGKKVYESGASSLMALIRSLQSDIKVEHSYVIDFNGEPQTIVLGKVLGAKEVELTNEYVEEYQYDKAYSATKEEKEETMNYNPMDFGFTVDELDLGPNFDEEIELDM